MRYSCRCSFLEIYNESIFDLLNTSSINLQLREDVKRGCYVDGLSEHIVLNRTFPDKRLYSLPASSLLWAGWGQVVSGCLHVFVVGQ